MEHVYDTVIEEKDYVFYNADHIGRKKVFQKLVEVLESNINPRTIGERHSYKCFPFTCSLTTAYSFISNFPLVSAISKSRFRGRAMIYGHDEQIPPDY